MKFSDIVRQAVVLLQEKGRITHGALKREFDLDDDAYEDLKEELIEGEQVAREENNRVLIWTGGEAVSTERLSTAAIDPETVASAPISQATAPAPGAALGERRQLTVMFCDLVGSTALSEQLDPEELQAVVRTYQEVSAQVIERYEGHIAQYLGDGLLVYFGYPAAHEDDAARAIRAGLEIVTALDQARSQFPQPVQVRIGIHTGPVVVGQMGGGSRHEQLALGETPNIAARVQGKAAPNEVVISAATQRLVAGLFEWEDQGRHELKGISTPQPLSRVTAESTAQSRFEAAVRVGLTPLAGREQELGVLRERWTQAQADAGQVVLLSGEAGIGKSRLVQELTDRTSQDRATRIAFQCSPYHQNSALYPITAHLQRLLRFTPDETSETKLDKLQQQLGRYRFPQANTLALFAALLSLLHPEGVPPITVSPQKQKELTQTALVAWLMEETEQQPVYNSWEDLHWADPSTLEVLDLLLTQVPTTRLLAVLTFRPEFVPPWGAYSYLSQVTLTRLGQSQVSAMVERVTGGKPLPEEVLQQIVTKTDGVPLFVEELTKMVVESDLVRAVNSHYELTGPLPPLAIPSTLQDSLMARLDRLATAREIAQVGATIGREFSYALLQAVSPIGEENLQQGLQQLVEVELLYQHGLPPRARYTFKHALIQDTAYASLLKRRRQQLHQAVAHVLEQQFAETVEAQPELVAHHYTEAGLVEQAIPYWQRAGQRAASRSANTEAIGHLTTALTLLKPLPDTPEHVEQELFLQTALGPVLMAAKGLAAPEVGNAYGRARELCQRLGETPQLFPVLKGLCVFHTTLAEHKTARELAEQCLRLAQSTQDPALLTEAHYGLGNTLYYSGEFALAREHFEQSLARYDVQQHRSHALLYGQDTGVVCSLRAALVVYYLGYADQARKLTKWALARAHELSHSHSLAYALASAAILHQVLREGQAAQEQAEATITLSTDQGFPVWVAVGTRMHGWALAEQGRGEEGVSQIRRGMASFQATGAKVSGPYFLGLLAEACEKTDQVEEGLRAVGDALTIVDKHEERHYEAELYRLKGELLLKQSPTHSPEAETSFHKALDVSRGQQARSLELRAAMSLARLWQQQGKTTEAQNLLAPVYHWFTEGFDTPDLKDAKALLDALSEGA